MELTAENYYSPEANAEYMSVSQFKSFAGTDGKLACEAEAMAELRGEWEMKKTICTEAVEIHKRKASDRLRKGYQGLYIGFKRYISQQRTNAGKIISESITSRKGVIVLQ